MVSLEFKTDVVSQYNPLTKFTIIVRIYYGHMLII
jgi:hypothetical protein